MLQIIDNILFYIKINSFWFCYYQKLFVVNVHYLCYNDFIKMLQIVLVILLCWYKRYSNCLILFSSLCEFSPAFIWANSLGSLVNSLFGVKILISVSLLLYRLLVLCQLILFILFDVLSANFSFSLPFGVVLANWIIFVKYQTNMIIFSSLHLFFI